MKDEELTGIDSSSFEPETASLNKPSTYDLLVRQSKKLGGVATKTFDDIKTVLNYEIPMPPANRFIKSITHGHKAKPVRADVREIAELKKMVKKSHEVLAKARTVFPVTLFPDDVILDRMKITIIKRDFFWSSSVISIQVRDILNVSTSVGPLFGSLTIASRVMNSIDHFEINYLWRGDAVQLKNMIQGYAIAKHSNIDTDHLSKVELVDMLSDLGTDTDKR